MYVYVKIFVLCMILRESAVNKAYYTILWQGVCSDGRVGYGVATDCSLSLMTTKRKLPVTWG